MTLHPDAITQAARMMTAVDPPAGLEDRIKRRLDRDTPRARAHTTRFLWPAAGLIAAGLVALVMVKAPADSGSRGSGVVEVPGSRGSDVVEVPAGPRGSDVVEVAALSSSPRLPVSAPIRLPAYRSMSESEQAWMSRRVPALDSIDPIQPERVSITPLTMTPLTTLPMYGDPDAWRQ